LGSPEKQSITAKSSEASRRGTQSLEEEPSSSRMEKTHNMRIDDFARPETMIRGAVKLLVGLLALLLLPTLLQVLIRAIPGLAVVMGLAIVSLVAYAVREGGRTRSRRTEPKGGAERTPVLPTDEEDL